MALLEPYISFDCLADGYIMLKRHTQSGTGVVGEIVEAETSGAQQPMISHEHDAPAAKRRKVVLGAGQGVVSNDGLERMENSERGTEPRVEYPIPSYRLLREWPPRRPSCDPVPSSFVNDALRMDFDTASAMDLFSAFESTQE